MAVLGMAGEDIWMAVLGLEGSQGVLGCSWEVQGVLVGLWGVLSASGEGPRGACELKCANNLHTSTPRGSIGGCNSGLAAWQVCTQKGWDDFVATVKVNCAYVLRPHLCSPLRFGEGGSGELSNVLRAQPAIYFLRVTTD